MFISRRLSRFLSEALKDKRMWSLFPWTLLYDRFCSTAQDDPVYQEVFPSFPIWSVLSCHRSSMGNSHQMPFRVPRFSLSSVAVYSNKRVGGRDHRWGIAIKCRFEFLDSLYHLWQSTAIKGLVEERLWVIENRGFVLTDYGSQQSD